MSNRSLSNVVRAIHEELQVYAVKGKTKIRLGDDSDGGYVVLNDITLKTAPQLISFGVGNDIGFEKGFLLNSETTPEVFIYDIVKPDIILPETFNFKQCNALRLKECTVKKGAVLKMDVEGAEWVTLSLSIFSKHILSFSQIIVEFHFWHVEAPKGLTPYFTKMYENHADFMNYLSFSEYLRTLQRLNEHFTLYHIHPNNSLPAITIGGYSMAPLIECSFIRTDLIKSRKFSNETFPTELDAPNKMDRSDYSNIQPPERLC